MKTPWSHLMCIEAGLSPGRAILGTGLPGTRAAVKATVQGAVCIPIIDAVNTLVDAAVHRSVLADIGEEAVSVETQTAVNSVLSAVAGHACR